MVLLEVVCLPSLTDHIYGDPVTSSWFIQASFQLATWKEILPAVLQRHRKGSVSVTAEETEGISLVQSTVVSNHSWEDEMQWLGRMGWVGQPNEASSLPIKVIFCEKDLGIRMPLGIHSRRINMIKWVCCQLCVKCMSFQYLSLAMEITRSSWNFLIHSMAVETQNCPQLPS